eukprot:2778532-Amphidinium_carterae.1
MRVKRSDGGGHEPVSRNKPAIVGHVNFDPDKSAEQFYYSKILMHTVWRDPGDWLHAKDEGKHIKAFHRADRARVPQLALLPNHGCNIRGSPRSRKGSGRDVSACSDRQ